MKCPHCGSDLIWLTDHDISQEDESFRALRELQCRTCGVEAHVFFPKEYKNETLH